MRSTVAVPGSAPAGHHSADEVGRVEARGIDYVAEGDRRSHPSDLAWAMFGPQFGFGNMVFGSLGVHAAFWRLTRAQLTFVISAIGLAAAYIALIAFNAIDSIEAFATLMLVTVSPWMVIMTVGHLMRHGRYEPMDLQAFAGSAKTGVYWFTGGFNIRAFVAWGAAVAVGMPRRRTTWRSLTALAKSNRRGGGWELRFQVV